MEGAPVSDGDSRSDEVAMGAVLLTRKIEFSASHLYHNPALSAEENRRIFGKCNNPWTRTQLHAQGDRRRRAGSGDRHGAGFEGAERHLGTRNHAADGSSLFELRSAGAGGKDSDLREHRAGDLGTAGAENHARPLASGAAL